MSLEKIINVFKKPVLVGAILGCLYGGIGSWSHEKAVRNLFYLAGQGQRYSPTVSDYFFCPTFITNSFLGGGIHESAGNLIDFTAPLYESYPINSAFWGGIGAGIGYGGKKIRKKFKKK
ncbi:MAG TPA: hypothetical protein VMZ91_12880 [Candidatus Paceibacterota bacterium]|nr:hypothetical protein [Candidatus Paceibacterota bacterium]